MVGMNGRIIYRNQFPGFQFAVGGMLAAIMRCCVVAEEGRPNGCLVYVQEQEYQKKSPPFVSTAFPTKAAPVARGGQTGTASASGGKTVLFQIDRRSVCWLTTSVFRAQTTKQPGNTRPPQHTSDTATSSYDVARRNVGDTQERRRPLQN